MTEGERFLSALRKVPAEQWEDAFDDYHFLGDSWSAWTKAFHKLLGTELGMQCSALWQEACTIVGWEDTRARGRLAVGNACYAVVAKNSIQQKHFNLLAEAVGLVGVRL